MNKTKSKEGDKTITHRIPISLADKFDRTAKKRGLNKHEAMVQALELFTGLAKS